MTPSVAPESKESFWALFLFGILTTFWQQFRIAQADLARETKDALEDALVRKVLSSPPPTPPPSVFTTVVPTRQEARPDIGMEFVNPDDVAFRMVNLSNVVLRDPKYGFALMDLDGHRTTLENGVSLPDILPIPAFVDAGDFLRAKRKFMPRAIVSTFPAVRSAVKPNDRIFGWVTVSCPNCVKDRTYVVFFVNGKGGWYRETSGETKVNFSDILLGDTDRALESLAPSKTRIPITANH